MQALRIGAEQERAAAVDQRLKLRKGRPARLEDLATPLHDLGLDLGMHAEIEFTMEGTVTVFAGPKGGVSGKIGQYGGDFGVKDGIYAVIDRNGVKDVGMRVVIGGGVAAGQAGGTHDVESMDFSFVSAL